MSAYYNEFDKYPAEWILNLITRGYVPPGVVDDRSIKSVVAEDLREATQAHFFAGIAVWAYALRLAGVSDDFPVWTGSCPCQPFSQAGAGKGFDDERHLWPDWFGLIKKRHPALIFGEQVSSPDGLGWLDTVYADLEGEDYTVWAGDLCSAGFGAPHRRHRLYFVAYADIEGLRSEWFKRLPLNGDSPHGHNVDGRGSARELANAVLAGRPERGSEPRRGSAPWGSSVVSLADAVAGARWNGRARAERIWTTLHSWRVGRRREQRARGIRQPGTSIPQQGSVGGSGFSGGLGNSDSSGVGQYTRELPRDESEHAKRQAHGDHAPVNPSPVVELGNTDDKRSQRRRKRRHSTDERVAGAASVAGFWGNAEWIYCRDGQHRPVEPGTFPLVDGAAYRMDSGSPLQGKARVGLLKAYGNAINAQQAAHFIRAFFDFLQQP